MILPLEQLTVGQLLQRTVSGHSGRKALWHEGRSWTYGELEAETAELSALLVSAGVKKGTHVGIWAELEPDTVLFYYAVQRIGAVTVLLNTNLVEDEMRTLLTKNDVTFLLVGKSYKTGCSLAAGTAAMLTEVVPGGVFTIGEERAEDLPALRDRMDAVTAEDRAEAARMEEAVRPEDTAAILFTSGSTSLPKGVMTSHYSRVNSGIQQASDLLCTEEDRFCVTMPVFHCFCISVNLMAALAVGGCLCIPRDRHIKSILDTIEACGCTVMSSVPTMFHAMLARKKTEGRNLDTLRIGFIGGANYPPEDFLQIDEAMGPQFTLMSSLGQTECTAGLTTCYASDTPEVRSRTVGHFMSHVEGRIADIHTGETLPTGQMGEICARGYLNMQGYYGMPELTAKTIDSEGWIHTGDLGILDADGNLTMAGRLKELIIRGGENISPSELEVVLDQMAGVARCKVVGVPDSHYGEEICACILPEEGLFLTENGVRAYLGSHLAAYKVPKYVLFFDEFPTTATGKIKPAAVRTLALAKLGL